jgi:hypothetical protein
MHSSTGRRLGAAAVLVAGALTLTACDGSSTSPSAAATSSHASSPAATSSAAVSLGPNERLGTLADGQTVVQYVPPDDSQPEYYDNGQLARDAQGNEYGLDGKLVRTADGHCAQGLDPTSPPEQNICFDPSLVPGADSAPSGDLQVGVEDGRLQADLSVGN